MLLGPVMSLVSNCDDTHVIEVGVFEQRAGGGAERLSSTFVKPPAPRPPLGFPVWLESKTDGPNGRMDRHGRPSLCCEPGLTRASFD